VLAFEADKDPDYAAMRSRLIRALLTVAVFAMVWLVAAPAFASTRAPVCDPRGATTFAPPPQLQDLEQSLDVVEPEDCAARSEETRHVTSPKRAPRVVPSAGQEPATAGPPLPVACAESERLSAPVAKVPTSSPGYRTPLERPPRA
jgi:hypothetical protein